MTPEQTLEKMRIVSANFYHGAQLTECHAFIEFSGLMNEYIKICEENLAQGIDFRELNGHRSQRMIIQPYEVDYVNEKLHCIYQGLIVVEGVKRDG